MKTRRKELEDLAEDLAYGKRNNDLINRELDALPKGKIDFSLVELSITLIALLLVIAFNILLNYSFKSVKFTMILQLKKHKIYLNYAFNIIIFNHI